MLAPTLGRYRRLGAFQDLQQRLLDTLAGDVPGDRRVLALASDLVDLIDVNNAGLCALDVVVGSLDELEQNVLDVLTDVTGLGECGGVGDGERDVEHLGERLGQIGLSAPRGPEHQNVRLGQLDRLGPRFAGLLACLDPLVVVVDRDRQGALCGVLPDDVVLQEFPDLGWLRQLVEFDLVAVGQFLFDDLVAQVDTFVTDIDAGSCDELLDLFLALPAERALQQVTAVSDTRHGGEPYFLRHREACCRMSLISEVCYRSFSTLPAGSAVARPIKVNSFSGIRSGKPCEENIVPVTSVEAPQRATRLWRVAKVPDACRQRASSVSPPLRCRGVHNPR